MDTPLGGIGVLSKESTIPARYVSSFHTDLEDVVKAVAPGCISLAAVAFAVITASSLFSPLAQNYF
ncbi:hypothetical protein HRbin02_01665 [Candidatus Calditenuaceae archaeon HR02]|nr:hypothetical protein HRbin02_01665 [Candidatus Calditenuaceae archaeon HR02]